MRLQVLENGFRPLQKLILFFIKMTSGGHVAGPILVMSYRRELFGKYLPGCFQEGMRAAKHWTVGEVEVFAAFISNLVEEALYVCFLFNLIDRLADAFDFHIPTEEGFQEAGRFLYKKGYLSGSIPG